MPARIDLALDGRSACGNVADHAREVEACHSSGTTAFTVADADGNVVAVTQTLGTWGGNFYVAPGLGFIYNDKLTSYGTDPSQYGARLPYARHGSTLAPTIVFQGTGSARRPVLAVGAAGNAWITSAVYETLVGVLDFGLSPQQALELPRVPAAGAHDWRAPGVRGRRGRRVRPCHAAASPGDGVHAQRDLAGRRAANGLRRRDFVRQGHRDGRRRSAAERNRRRDPVAPRWPISAAAGSRRRWSS